MNTVQMIHELRRLHEVHRNDKVYTGETNWSNLCRDVADRLMQLDGEVYRLRMEVDRSKKVKMVTTESMIHELRILEKLHKDDKVYTGQINWSNLYGDVADRLEELNDKLKRLSQIIIE